MQLSDVRKKYLDFFSDKVRRHVIIPSASLVPENDPTTLFVGSGMQPLVPYLLGASHPEGKRVANSQKSFRAEDIDEVGDNRHTTFFEMLGNWSFGDYFKEKQLPWIFEFLTKEIGLKPERLYVTVFAGDPETKIPADTESVEIWKKLFEGAGVKDAKYIELGSEKQGSEKGMQGGRIFSYDIKKNWWSRAGVPAKMPAGEPGGPDSEIFFDFDPSGKTHDPKFGNECHPNCDCGRFLEIGNSVFMEYKKKEDGTFEKLAQRNVDFGGGLERITAASNNDPDVFNIDVFKFAMDYLEKEFSNARPVWSRRIIADHSRAMMFLIGDGVLPSNKGSGYVLRRLMRRALAHLVEFNFFDEIKPGEEPKKFHYYDSLELIVKKAVAIYSEYKPYGYLSENQNKILMVVRDETEKFLHVQDKGEKILHELMGEATKNNSFKIPGEKIFDLVTTHGVPLDWIKDQAKTLRSIDLDLEGFETLFKKHQNLSRTSSAGTFKGGLADHSEKTTKLHTAHHLLLKALQIVLGPNIKQRGSNITSERLRLDFSYDGKMTDEQKKEVERIVKEKIAEDLPVIHSELAKEVAEKLGAEHEFGQKYPDRVSIYSIGPKSATLEKPQFEKAYSIEFCGGPHVAHTGVIGKFKIAKEEAVSAGVRRVRGVVE